MVVAEPRTAPRATIGSTVGPTAVVAADHRGHWHGRRRLDYLQPAAGARSDAAVGGWWPCPGWLRQPGCWPSCSASPCSTRCGGPCRRAPVQPRGPAAAAAGRIWQIPTGAHLHRPRPRPRRPPPAADQPGSGGAGARDRAVRHGRDRQDPAGLRLRPHLPGPLPARLVDPRLNLSRGHHRPRPACGAPGRLRRPAHRSVACPRARDVGRPDRWLLVFDNATDPAELEPLLRLPGGGHVLLTSRNPA
jgi:hypothetical protein